jgi:tRNA(adenine34) deaminase
MIRIMQTPYDRSPYEYFMRTCIELARRAGTSHDTLVGSLVVCNGRIIGEGVEGVRAKADITAHAEIEAVKASCVALKSLLLEGCVLYTTAEPCFMCSYAIRQARISQVVIGRRSPDMGGVSSKFPILTDPAIENWWAPPEVVTGILQKECEELMRKTPR